MVQRRQTGSTKTSRGWGFQGREVDCARGPLCVNPRPKNKNRAQNKNRLGVSTECAKHT